MARQHAGHRAGEAPVHQLVHQQLSRRRSALHAEVQSGRLGQDRRPHDQLHPPGPDECVRPKGPERQRQGDRGLAGRVRNLDSEYPEDRTVPAADGRGHPRDCDRVRAPVYAGPHSRRRRRCTGQCLVQRQQKPVRRQARSEDRQGDQLPAAGTRESGGPQTAMSTSTRIPRASIRASTASSSISTPGTSTARAPGIGASRASIPARAR